MASHPQSLHDPASEESRGAYLLIVRGPDGRPRSERFNDPAAYRARLLALKPVERAGLSIEELAGWLDL